MDRNLEGGSSSGPVVISLLAVLCLSVSGPAAEEMDSGEAPPPRGAAVTFFSEDFETAGIPSSWLIVDGGNDGKTWFADDASDPQGCGNSDPNPPVAGTWAAIDADCSGFTLLDEALITPIIDLGAASRAVIAFDHFFRYYAGGPNEKGDLDVRSSATGGLWLTMRRWQSSTANSRSESVDITPQAAGQSDVQIRFHYYDANWDWYWFLDNVVIDDSGASAPPDETSEPPFLPPFVVGKGGGGVLDYIYGPACGATSHSLYWGLSPGPLSGLAWSGSDCLEDADGTGWFDPGTPPSGSFFYFVIVGANALGEGSYGTGSSGTGRPDAEPAVECAVYVTSGNCSN